MRAKQGFVLDDTTVRANRANSKGTQQRESGHAWSQEMLEEGVQEPRRVSLTNVCGREVGGRGKGVGTVGTCDLVCLSVCVWVCLSVCLCVCVSVCMCVCL